jgi:DNA-directed RNA polymerase subunit RPC12/RpoP
MANEMRLVDANALWHKTFTCEDAADVRKEIENAPTVDAVPVVHGRWERGIAYFMCSECRKDAPISSLTGKQYKANYCPNCGSLMDGGNEDV